jgi:hypothetical protein
MTTVASRPVETPPRRLMVATIVAALTLPTIVGVAVFAALALFAKAPPADFNPNAEPGLLASIGLWVMFGAFFGAAYGPLLIPIATGVVLAARRHGAPRLSLCWALIILAVVATAVSYYWALDAVELP